MRWPGAATLGRGGDVGREKGMSQSDKKRALKKALFSSGSKKFKKIGRLPPEEQAEAHKTTMRDVAGDLGITDEKTLQQLEDHALKEFRRKMN